MDGFRFYDYDDEPKEDALDLLEETDKDSFDKYTDLLGITPHIYHINMIDVCMYNDSNGKIVAICISSPWKGETEYRIKSPTKT